MEEATRVDAYAQLIALLEKHGTNYRLIDHPPEGRTKIVSQLRGNAVEQAAKCIVLMVKLGKKSTKYILAVVPGNARIDLDAVKKLVKGICCVCVSTGGGEAHWLCFRNDIADFIQP